MSKGIFDKVVLNKEKLNVNINSIRESYEAEEAWYKINAPREEALYTEFVRCNKNKDFLDLDHIDALGVEYDILIVTSIKNTGKNVGIVYKMFNKYYKEGKKVMFMRTSQAEIDASIGEYNTTPANPFLFRTTKKQCLAFHKETGDEVGCFKSFKFCNSGSGGEFDGYGAIIYDECLSWDPVKRLTASHYLNWAALVSSITRNKQDGIKIYCVGNLTGLNMGLLDFYGIKRDDNLRYIERCDKSDPSNKCKILYINVNDIYRGIKAQKGAVQAMAPEYKNQLYQNQCDLNNLSIINPKVWDELTAISSFIFVTATTLKQYVIELKENASDRYEPGKKFFALRVRDWAPYLTINGPIYTDNAIIHNANDRTTLIDSIDEELYNLSELSQYDTLYYYDKPSQDICIILVEKVKKWTKLKYF